MEDEDVPMIFLLMQENEADYFIEHLSEKSLDTAFIHVSDIEELREALEEAPKKKRLFAFCTKHIVPDDILDEFNGEAYNFHPGPPERPGRYPSIFAVNQGAKEFGFTFHRMTKNVDEGPIIAAFRFDLEEDFTVQELEKNTYQYMLGLIKHIAELLVNLDHVFQEAETKWSNTKTTRQDALKLPEGDFLKQL